MAETDLEDTFHHMIAQEFNSPVPREQSATPSDFLQFTSPTPTTFFRSQLHSISGLGVIPESSGRPASDRPRRSESAASNLPVLTSRIRHTTRVQISAHGKRLFVRNRITNCRSLFFGLAGLLPFTVGVFLLSSSFILKVMALFLQLFGFADVIISFTYYDKLVEMFKQPRQRRRLPRGCIDHQKLALCMSLLYFPLFLATSYFLVQDNFHARFIIFSLQSTCFQLLYLLALCSIKTNLLYLMFVSSVLWLVLALPITAIYLVTFVLTCGKIKLGYVPSMYERGAKVLKLPDFLQMKKNKTDDLSCSVCLQQLKVGQKALILPCMEKAPHSFHYECGNRWLRKYNTCPLCRKDYRAEQEQKTIWEKIWFFRDVEI